MDDLNIADPQLVNVGAVEEAAPSVRLDLPAQSAHEESYRLSVSNVQETEKTPSKTVSVHQSSAKQESSPDADEHLKVPAEFNRHES